MDEYWRGGKGKVAPYKTSHTRIPLPIKETVELLSQVWKRALSAGRDTESLLAQIQECTRKWVVDEENPVTGKDETGQHLEVDKLKAEIDILKQSLAAKETELELFKTMTQDKKAIACDLVSEYLNGKGMPKTRNWVEMNRFIEWLSQP